MFNNSYIDEVLAQIRQQEMLHNMPSKLPATKQNHIASILGFLTDTLWRLLH